MKTKLPILLTLFAIIGGVFISILFGANEELFKKRIQDGLSKNVKIQAIADASEKEAKLKSEAEKNWRYYQRYHFHANGIASLTLTVIILLAFVEAKKTHLLAASYLVSVGGFLYPFVWLLAALYGPEMGRSEAKETFAIFGYMGGVYLIGILDSFYLAITRPWKAPLNLT